jgi:hypothetical protein
MLNVMEMQAQLTRIWEAIGAGEVVPGWGRGATGTQDAVARDDPPMMWVRDVGRDGTLTPWRLSTSTRKNRVLA